MIWTEGPVEAGSDGDEEVEIVPIIVLRVGPKTDSLSAPVDIRRRTTGTAVSSVNPGSLPPTARLRGPDGNRTRGRASKAAPATKPRPGRGVVRADPRNDRNKGAPLAAPGQGAPQASGVNPSSRLGLPSRGDAESVFDAVEQVGVG